MKTGNCSEVLCPVAPNTLHAISLPNSSKEKSTVSRVEETECMHIRRIVATDNDPFVISPIEYILHIKRVFFFFYEMLSLEFYKWCPTLDSTLP